MLVHGYCPTLKKEHSIDVEYIGASTLDKKSSIKGLFTCSVVSYGEDCPVSRECPLYKNAPPNR